MPGATNRDLTPSEGGATLGIGMVVVHLLHCAEHCPEIVGVRYMLLILISNSHEMSIDVQQIGPKVCFIGGRCNFSLSNSKEWIMYIECNKLAK